MILQPGKNRYISKKLFDTITAFLDSKQCITKIVKVKRIKNYQVYIDYKIVGKATKTRNAAKWKIYEKYLELLNK